MRLGTAFALVAAAAGFIWQRASHWMDDPPALSRPLDPAFVRLTPLETATLPLAARFDMPLGSEHGALTYNARGFRIERHLGDDLNGIGGGNSDLGDPVCAAGAGRVIYAGVPGVDWGNMILIAHRLPDGDELGPVVQTVYAHLASMNVRTGQDVRRGEVIGTVGTAKSAPLAHLHFEVRTGPYVNPGQGYADTALNRVSPEKFIQARRGAEAISLNPAPQNDRDGKRLFEGR
ncbi:MAG: M23 family metallopeptidase [Verrucomicrobiaceae bacterium]|nr:M23 family metallopeptidase [Verrucomicrobiaceae bacterium]